MKKQIWKFYLNETSTVVEMPKNAAVLTVQNQNGAICIRALVDPAEKATEPRLFEIYGTGHDIPYDMGVDRVYINTFLYYYLFYLPLFSSYMILAIYL